MTKFVRVQLENGSKASIPESVAKSAGYEVLDEDALDGRGRPRDVEFPDTPAPEGYDALHIDRLRELVDERNEGRDDSDKLSKGGSKSALADRLTADDNAHSDS